MANRFEAVLGEAIRQRNFDLSMTFHHPQRVKLRNQVENLLAYKTLLPEKFPGEVLDSLASAELVEVLADMSLDEPVRLCRLAALVEEKKHLPQEKMLDNPT